MPRRDTKVLVALGAVVGLSSASLAFCVSVSGDTRSEPRPEPAPSPVRSASDTPAPADAAPAVRVEGGPTLSPITPEVVRRLREIASGTERNDDVFVKIGDSATVSRAFLECFGGDPSEIDLGEHEQLRATLDHFRDGNAGGIDPFRRDSEAAHVGWNARHLLTGSPPPLLREIRAASPRFAFVLNGGNDVEGHDPARFANRMLRIVRHLERRGVVPILGSITPRRDDPEAEAWVRRYNGVTRAIARAEHLPYIDFHQALENLPRQGLASDGVHPNVAIRDGDTRPCDLSAVGLRHGNNVRNLLALQMLDVLRRTVVDGEPAPHPSRPGLRGRGSVEDPFVVESLPLADMKSTAGAPNRDLDRYGCSDVHDESGPEHVYRLRLDQPRRVRAWVFSEGGVDVDVHLLRERPEPDACVARDDAEVIRDLDAGTWFVVVDTFVDEEGPHAGRYMIVVDVETPLEIHRG